ncbi:MAG: hypothetical protein Q4E69_06490 [Bacilli bacterium]|nr:hypothetical protein [Bacilli bacterium]
MEKIYMEENRNQAPKKRRSLLSSTSIMMSFVLAFVAIVSIAAFGFSQVSYAIPEESESPFPTNITTIAEDADHTVKGLSSASPLIALHRANIGGTTKYVYCIESDVDIESGASYEKTGKITDKGLLFLLNYLASDNYQIVDGSNTEVNELTRGWIVQSALWVYLHETGYPHNTGVVGDTPYFNDAAIAAVKADTTLYVQSDGSDPIFAASGGIYATCSLKNSGLSAQDSTIIGLIEKAKRIKAGTEAWNNFDLTISKASDKITMTEDGDFLVSDVVTVNGSEGFEGFKVSDTGLPTGTKFIGTDGNEITNLDNLANGTQFTVKIPKANITDANKNVTISITAAFTGKAAYYYGFTNTSNPNAPVERQKVAFVGTVTQHVNKGVVIPFDVDVPTEDTGITAAQSVYFIGLIILLAGVGIIYANIKPREVKE